MAKELLKKPNNLDKILTEQFLIINYGTNRNNLDHTDIVLVEDPKKVHEYSHKFLYKLIKYDILLIEHSLTLEEKSRYALDAKAKCEIGKRISANQLKQNFKYNRKKFKQYQRLEFAISNLLNKYFNKKLKIELRYNESKQDLDFFRDLYQEIGYNSKVILQ